MTARVLIFRGGWQGHDPVPTSDLVAETLRERGLEVDIQDNQACLLESGLTERYQLIVPVWTMGEIGKAEAQALTGAVAQRRRNRRLAWRRRRAFGRTPIPVHDRRPVGRPSRRDH